MEEYSLNELELIAQGGEADIFNFDEDKVLRVLRKASGKTFETEKLLFPILAEYHINVPMIYEYIKIEGLPAQIMQKVVGNTMLERIQQHPFKLIQEIKKFAGMHAQLLEIESNCELSSIDKTFHHFITQPSNLDEKLIDFVLKMMKELPINNYICHGDFHPRNILVRDNEYFIIDWSGAYRSNFVSDIAHTYLLMTHVPEIPGQGHMQHSVISLIGSYMAKTYLKEILRLKEFSLVEFSKWTVVMSFLRSCYGLSPEKPARINYLNKCYELSKKGIDTATWYKYL